MENEVDFKAMFEQVQHELDALKLKEWHRRQRTPLLDLIAGAWEWIVEDRVRIVYALALFYMTPVFLHAHWNLFTEHQKRMRE